MRNSTRMEPTSWNMEITSHRHGQRNVEWNKTGCLTEAGNFNAGGRSSRSTSTHRVSFQDQTRVGNGSVIVWVFAQPDWQLTELTLNRTFLTSTLRRGTALPGPARLGTGTAQLAGLVDGLLCFSSYFVPPLPPYPSPVLAWPDVFYFAHSPGLAELGVLIISRIQMGTMCHVENIVSNQLKWSITYSFFFTPLMLLSTFL